MQEHGSQTMIAEPGRTLMEILHMVLDHGKIILELARELSKMKVLTTQSSLLTPHLITLKQTPSTLPQLLVKTVAGQMPIHTGSNSQKDYNVNNKKMHHPQAAIISV